MSHTSNTTANVGAMRLASLKYSYCSFFCGNILYFFLFLDSIQLDFKKKKTTNKWIKTISPL